MKTLLMRLDDACPKRDVEKWDRTEALLDKYNVRPLVGVIPDCKDPDMEKYEEDETFWTEKIPAWKAKNWTLAMHGFEHLYCTGNSGTNPVNKKSEFAGLPFEKQCEKIKSGIEILRGHGIEPEVFFAPAHTFDMNTVKALLHESGIRIISDVPADKPFSKDGMTFVPQQSGRARNLPFSVQTFCYHPNTMQDKDFDGLETFLQKHKFSDFPLEQTKRKLSLYDLFLMKIYYWRHR